MNKSMSMNEQLSKISVELFGQDCTDKKEDAIKTLKKANFVSKKEEKSNKKKKYPILFTGEDYCTAYVEMTEEEALIVERILKDAVAQVKGYCGRVYLDMGR